MKKILRIIVVVALFLLTVSGYGQSNKFRDIAGKWEVLGENGEATLNIIDSSTIEFVYLGEKKTISDCSIDFTKSPYWLDFSATDSTSSFKVQSLVQKVGDDVLKWQLFIDEDRAPHFSSSKGEVFYLRKARPVSPVAAATTTSTIVTATATATTR